MSVQNKSYWLHFLLYISSDKDEICCGGEAIQAEHTETTLVSDFFEQGR